MKNGWLTYDEIRAKENLPAFDIEFIKLGLDSVLFYPKDGKIYIPNTGVMADMNNPAPQQSPNQAGAVLPAKGTESPEGGKTMKIEIRSKTEARIEGYVNVCGRESRAMPSPHGRYTETVRPGTFQQALNKGNAVQLKFNHARVLGGTDKGNLELREDNIGLAPTNLYGKEFRYAICKSCNNRYGYYQQGRTKRASGLVFWFL